MRRRTLIPLATLIAVIAVLAVLPATPAGRGWLLERATEAAARQGLELRWQASAGNAWSGIELRGVEVTGSGLEARAGHARVDWFLPSLLAGELPLWVELGDFDADLEAGALDLAGDGGDGGLPVRPVLRELRLEGARVQIDDAPFTLPDLALEELQVDTRTEGFGLAGRVLTDQGAATFDGRAGLSPARLDLDLSDVDARLARHWWQGVEAGRGEGRLRWDASGLHIDLDVEEGAIRTAGLEVREVAGSIAMQGRLIETELSGSSLGGPVAATGRVDVANRSWSASLRATPDLEEAATFRLPFALPQGLRPQGEALVSATASGWTSVSVRGNATAEGDLAGRPFAVRTSQVRYRSGEGLSFDAQGDALGGEFTARQRPEPEDGREMLEVTLQAATLGPLEGVHGRVGLASLAAPEGGLPPGTFELGAGGDLAGRAVALSVDGDLGRDGIAAYLSGTESGGGSLEGAAVLDGGTVEGRLRVLGTHLPMLEGPVDVALAAQGPLDALALEAELIAEEPLRVAVDGMTVGEDLRGRARARLAEGTLEDVVAELGAVEARGDLALWGAEPGAPRTLSIRADDVPLDGPVSATASLHEGELRWDAEGLAVSGRLTVDGARAAGVRLPQQLEGELRAGRDGTLRFRGERLDAAWRDGGAELEARALPLAWSGEAGASTSGTLDGALRARPVDGEADGAGDGFVAEGWRFDGDLTLDAGPLRAELSAEDGALRAAGTLPAGVRLAGRTLAQPVAFALALDESGRGPVVALLNEDTAAAAQDALPRQEAEEPPAEGTAFQGRLRLAEAPLLSGTLRGGGEALAVELRRDPWVWSARGAVALAPWSSALDLPLEGRLAVDASGTLRAASGEAQLDLEAPLQASAQLASRPGEPSTWTVEGSASSPLGPLELSGRFDPWAPAAASLRAGFEHGEVRLEDGRLMGEGTVPGQSWRDVRVAPQEWRLEGSLAEAGAELAAGDSRARLEWSDGLTWRADLDVPVRLADRPWRLSGEAEGGADLAAARLDARLHGEGGSLELTGPWGDVRITGTLEAPLLADAAELPGDLVEGEVAIDGGADLLRARGEAEATWRSGEARLELSLGAGPLRAEAQGEGLQADFTDGALSLAADGLDPSPFLPALSGARLTGDLRLDDGGWSGSVEVRPDARLPEALREARATLRGDEEGRLRLDGELRAGGAELRAEGPLLPRPELSVHGTWGDGAARFEGELAIEARPRLEGTLAWSRLDAGPLQVEPGAVRVEAGWAAGPDLRVEAWEGPVEGSLAWTPGGSGPVGAAASGSGAPSDGGAAEAEAGQDAPLTVTVSLLDQPHRLRFSHAPAPDAAPERHLLAGLRAAADGPLGSATARVQADGEVAWRAELAAEALPDTPALEVGAVRADGTATLDGSWRGEAATTLTPVAAGGLDAEGPLRARASAAGRGADWAGTASLRRPGAEAPLLTADAAGEGADLALEADLADLDVGALSAWLGRPLDADARGRVAWSKDAGVRVDAAVEGRDGAVPFSAELRIAEGPPEIDAHYGDWQASLVQQGDVWDWHLEGPDVTVQGVLEPDVARAVGRGEVRGAPAELSADLDPDARAGTVRASWAGAHVEARVEAADAGVAVAFRAELPEATELPLAGALEGDATWAAGTLRFQRLEADLRDPARAELALTGQAWPSLELTGGMRAFDLDAELSARGPLTGPTLSLRHDELRAQATLDPLGGDGPLSELSVRGSATLPLAGGLRIADADLSWSAADGYAGQATVALPGMDPVSPVTVLGAGEDLALGAELALDDGAVAASAEARLAGPPWAPRLPEATSLRAEAELPGGARAQLRAQPRLEREDGAWRVDGPLELSGPWLAEGNLSAGAGAAQLRLEGPALRLEAAADGDGWSAHATLDGLPLADLHPLLDDARATTVASASAAWGERPHAQLTDLRLEAPAGSLHGDVALDGTLAGRLTADLQAFDARARGELRLGGPPAQPTLEAELALTGAVDADLRARAQLQEGSVDLASLQLTTRQPVPARLELAGAAWPQLDLAGRVHALDLEAQVAATGTYDAPVLRATRDELALAAELDPGAEGGPLQRLALTGRGSLPFAGGVRVSSADLAWTPASGYRGSAGVTLEAAQLDATLAGADGALRMRATQRRPWGAAEVEVDFDLDAYLAGPPWNPDLREDSAITAELAAPGAPPVQLTARPRAQLDAEGGPRLEAPLVLGGAWSAEGSLELAADAVSLELEGPGLELSGRADADGWSARAELERLPLSPLHVDLNDTHLTGRADAGAGWQQAPTLELDDLHLAGPFGRLAGDARLDAALSFDGDLHLDLGELAELRALPLTDLTLAGILSGPVRYRASDLGALADGELDAPLEASGVRVQAVRADGSLHLHGSAARPRLDAELSVAGPARAEVRARTHLEEGTLRIDALDATLTQPAEAELALSGSAWPSLELRGSLAAFGVEAQLAAHGSPTAPTVTLSRDGLAAELALDPSGAAPVGRLALRGAGELPFAGGLRIQDAELAWTAADGYTGALAVQLERSGSQPLRIDARGDGERLRLEGGTSLAAQGVEARASFEAHLVGPPWRPDLHPDSAARAEVPLPRGEPLRVHAQPRLVRGEDAPRLQAPLQLGGPWPAEGELNLDADGATVELHGPHLDLRGRLEEGAWTVQGDLAELPLAPLHAELAGARLSAAVDAAGVGATQPRAELAELRVTSPTGTLTGEATLSEGRLNAALRADDMRLAGSDVSGTIDVRGPLAQPELHADLQLAGAAEGAVEVDWRPADAHVRLRSDLAVAGFDVDLEVGGTPGDLRASGGVRRGDGALLAEGEGERLRLLGEGAWQGARLDVRPFPAEGAPLLEARAPLAAADPRLAGSLDLRLDLAPTARVTGRVVQPGLSGSPVALPDLELVADTEALQLDGPGLRARLELADLAWSAEAQGLPLAEAGTLHAEARGRGASGTLTGRFTGAWADLELDAAYREGALEAGASGTVLDAPARLDAARDADGWRGTLAVEPVSVPGGELAVDGALAGAGAMPDVELETQLSGAVPASGTVTWRDGRAELRQEIDLPGLTPLLVTGALAPGDGAHVTLTRPGEDGAWTLHAAGWQEGAWWAEGELRVAAPGGAVTLLGGGPDGPAQVRVTPGAGPEGAWSAALPQASPAETIARIGREGLAFRGEGAYGGTAQLTPEPALRLDAARVALQGAELRFDGRLAPSDSDLRGRLELDPERSWFLQGIAEAPITLHATGGLEEAAVTIETARGGVEARVAPAQGSARAMVDLAWPDGSLAGTLTLADGEGASGSIEARSVPLELGPNTDYEWTGGITGRGAALEARAELRGEGRLTASAVAPLATWLPAAWLPPGAEAVQARASLRMRELDPSDLPGLAERLPYLDAPLDGVVELRGRRVIGQLSGPDIAIAGRPMPLRLEVTGDLQQLQVAGSLGDSPVQAELDAEGVSLLLRLRRFPVQAPLEAWVGPLDVDSEVTGVVRVTLPWDDPLGGEVRIATEQVRLEREGVVTTGTVSLDLVDRALEVREATFEGQGRWTASGTLRPDEFDFDLIAEGADATPLLGLVPSLARLQAGATGNLEVRARGDLQRPRVEIRSDGLELTLGGSSYRLSRGEAVLDGASLRTEGVLEGVEPLGGRLDFEGGGRFSLAPWQLSDARFTVQGALDVPVIGRLEAVDGAVVAGDDGLPRLDLEGRLGNPFRVEGTLWPLDLRAQGEQLALEAPPFLLASSVTDVDLTLAFDERFRLGGRVSAHQGRFSLGIRPQTEPPGEPDAPQGRNPLLERFVLDDLRVTGQRLAFSENFGSADLDLDLTLSGTVAAPQIAGTATAQRGALRFAGRDFELNSAQAVFERSRGVWPLLEVEAVTRFDKQQALSGAPPQARFVAPRDGNRIEVRLAFEGEVQPAPDDVRPFRLDLDPRLTSNAIIEVPSESELVEGPRPLTNDELVSLVTLGRLELSADLAGGEGLASTVAQSALDTAIDLLVLSELQRGLSEALGLDVVEIRTSALTSVLDGGDDPFGVSLRLGGYLTDEIFASYTVGRFSDEERALAFSNELAVTYELGPLAFDLSTRLGFPDAAGPPVPGLDAGIRYDLTERAALETGFTLSSPRSEARFGVTLRW